MISDGQGSTQRHRAGTISDTQIEGYGIGITGPEYEQGRELGSIRVNKDFRLIAELGFEKWWDIVLNGPVGLVHGAKVKGKNLYRCTLTQGREPCVCLFTEQEYKDLVVEAHYNCRYHVYHVIEGKDRRRWYWCLYCKEDFSDKNALSYHRHRNQCIEWRRMKNGKGGILKMYPTFKPSDTKAAETILAECGLKFPAKSGSQPWAPRQEGAANPTGAHGDGLGSTSRSRGGERGTGVIGSRGDKSHTKSRRSDALHAPSMRPRRMKNTVVSSPDLPNFAHKSSADTTTDVGGGSGNKRRRSRTGSQSTRDGSERDGLETRRKSMRRLQSVRETRSRKKTRVDSGSAGISGNAIDLGESDKEFDSPREAVAQCILNVAHSEGTGDDHQHFRVKPRNLIYDEGEEDMEDNVVMTEDQGEVQEAMADNGLHLPTTSCSPVSHISSKRRDEVLREAQREADLLTINDVRDLRDAPESVPVPGLYYLLSEGPISVVEKDLLMQPIQCMEHLTSMERNGKLSEKIISALGHWVQWRLARVVSKSLTS